MTASPHSPSPAQRTARRAPLRIRADGAFGDGPLDGGWWPHSRDLAVEAADLVDHFPEHVGGRIVRMLFSRPDWDAPAGAALPRQIQVRRGTVKVGSFPSDDTHLMILTMSSGARLRLLVIPSATGQAQARAALEQAADEHNRLTAAEILGGGGPDQATIGTDVWDDDGGL